MDPSQNPRPELQLPPPVAEYNGVPELTQNASNQAPAPVAEAQPMPPQQAPVPQNMPTAATPPALPPSNTDVTATTDVVVPDAADDQDLIEKEWVAKAKQIVNDTQDNPFEQSKQLTVFKSDYMQKRYNKSIKLSE